MALRFLLLEDSPSDAAVIEAMLAEGQIDCELLRLETRADFVAALETALETKAFDLILADYSLPQFDGISALEIACQICPDIPFIFVSASLGEELAIETLKRGATDYVLKQRLGRLVPCVQRALREAQERRERQRAEVALRQSEALLRTVAANLPNGAVFIVNQELRYILAEGKALENVGMVSEDLVGKTLEEALDPTLAAYYEPYYRQALRGESFSLEHYSHNRYYVSHSTPLRNDQGVVDAVLVVSHDITDRKLAEKALKRNEERLKSFVEGNVVGILFGDVYGGVHEANDELLRIIGYTREELQSGQVCWLDMTPSEYLDLDQQHILEAQEKGACVPYEKEYVRKDGTRVSVLVGYSLLGEAREESVAFILDLTDRKQANARLHLLYETTRDLLATHQPMQLMSNLFNKLANQLDLHHYYNYMVEMQHDRQRLHLKNYSGISEQAAATIEWIDFDQYLCGLVAKERRQIILNQTQIAQHPNAQLIHSLGITTYAGYPLIVGGCLLGTLAFASCTRTHFTPAEIDLLQSTCEQIAIAIERASLTASIQRQAEQLQQANQIKDEFLAVLSHELRSPLNPILGWARLLQTRKLDEVKTAQALSVIERNAKLQAELIEDLLDVSRILRGKLRLTVATVNPVSIIYSALETVRLAAESKSIQIQVNLEPSIGMVSGDPNRLQQVIWNLLSNAVKFTDAGGTVSIQLKAVASEAQIIVRDTGKGIHPDFLPHVFDYFRQEDGGTTRKFGGLGLGLAIVRHLVELHGGTVQAQSPGEGLGATFMVRLPLIPNALDRNLNLPRSEALPNLWGITILVVDDDADTREFLRFLLEQYEAKVTVVSSVVEAFAAFSHTHFDILVSDIGMPDQDGYMFLNHLRTLPPDQGGTTPAIALTAYAGETDQQQALLAGFQCHIPKPVDPTQFLKVVARLTHQRLEER
ncbi:MAG: response regulator [Elainella sp. Prado103]|jgi:PAS domain S-box-containing protein|nr:response regulator [Elainella sp. Prado103]